ncbi:hypothetical protein Aduo_005424 [Ancylostoma duodenale]
MLPDLCGTLLRARLTKYLIIADVEKAFHQIRLQEDQRDATRFLWLKDTSKPPFKDNLRILRFMRVPFGINASPFLLSISIKYALERDHANRLREEILANTYVDNVLIGANSTEECATKQKQCKETFERMHMNLREFMSNNKEVMDGIPAKDRMKQSASTVKLLGLQWNPQDDSLALEVKVTSKSVTTKRTALKAYASNFDPLGLLTPLLVKAKLFNQQLWHNSYKWDDPLKERDCNEWKKLVQEISTFSGTVPRFIGHTSEATYDIVVFSDASNRVCAAVAYLICRPIGTAQPYSNILMSESKLAPSGKITTPRMELLACHMAAKLSQFLRKELAIRLNSIRFLSDSQIALYWIHSKKTLKTFVNNRVKYIRAVMDELVSEKIETRFYYVSTESNPADCATRGLNASEIVDHTWWHGPGFILAPPIQWPNAHMDFTVDPPPLKDVEEEFRTVASSASLIEGYKSFVPFTRMTSYSKLVRVTAWCLKYLAKLLCRIEAKLQTADTTFFSKFTKASHISIDDFREAELIVLREHYREGALLLESRNIRKLHVKSDENGLFRADIRMANSELEESAKRPIVLLPGHPLTQMIIRHYHLKLFHAGAPHLISALREKYLIPNIRRKVKTISAKCITCKRQQGRPYSYPECPSLPAERVSRKRPFQNIGLDYFGPLLVRSDQSQSCKVWVCLFTCMATRALHLEVAADNSTAQFVFAFRRFIARRGSPVISDNAPNFKIGKTDSD